jgi:Holliday junction resolvase
VANLQTKLIRTLEDAGCYVVNITSASKNGVADILGCLPSGRFFAVESKEKSDRLKPLQKYNLDQVKKSNGLAIEARSVEDLAPLLAHINRT